MQSQPDVYSDCGKFKHGECEDCVRGLILFLLYINDLPLNINLAFTSLLFSDDTSIVVAEPDVSHVVELSSCMFVIMNKYLIVNFGCL
jgi:hypothetical protein